MDKLILAQHSPKYTFTISLVFIIGLMTVLCAVFDPYWATSDDVSMSMYAHGYGHTAYGSPNLLFSNVLWGHFVRALPTLDGLRGYTLATLLSLTVFGTALLYYLRKFGISWIIAFSVTAILFLRPLLFPQFTLNSGLLACTAFLALHAYTQHNDKRDLCVSVLMAFAAYLIRSQEFIFVMLVVLPLFPWSKLRTDRMLWVGLLVVGIVIIAASIIDYLSYQTPEWEHFQEINLARAPYTDFGAGVILKNRPEILKQYNVTLNDIDLISGFFFVDPVIMNPTLLNSMIAELGIKNFVHANINSAFASFLPFTYPNMRFVFLGALLLLIAQPNRPLILAWGIVLGMNLLLGLLGRGGLERVIFPLLVLLCVIGLLQAVQSFNFNKPRRYVQFCILLALISLFGHGLDSINIAMNDKPSIEQGKIDVKAVPDQTVVFGANLKLNYLLPLLTRNPERYLTNLYPLGVVTHAPISIAARDEKIGNSFIQRIRSKSGLNIAIETFYLDLLKRWCSERFDAPLLNKPIYESSMIKIQNISCPMKQ